MFGKDRRNWVNWKNLITSFALLSTEIPSEAELAQYRVALTDAGDEQKISLE
jgi:hypothetical protein